MKKMSFTNIKWWSLLGRSAALVLFAVCFAGLQSADAQVAVQYTANDTTCVVHKLAACNGTPTSSSTEFTDDGQNDGNYNDDHARRDTVEICPTDAWHFVKACVVIQSNVEPN